MYPVLVIAIGLVVLILGKRLSILGAAVGALLGVALVSLFPSASDPFTLIIVPLLLGVIGFFAVSFAKGIINIVILVLGVLAGAGIMLGFLELFTTQIGLLGWFLVAAGGVAGFFLVQRFKNWAVIILAGLIGGLLVTRGLTVWLPFLSGTVGTLLTLALAGLGVAYQGGYLKVGKTTK
jgi:hypothetical protein